MSELRTVFESSNSSEVYLKKAILENNGIQSVIEGEHSNQWFPHLSIANSNIKLKVLKEQYDIAFKVIFNKPLDKRLCPKCQSSKISSKQNYSLFQKLFTISIKKKWICQNCQHDWME